MTDAAERPRSQVLMARQPIFDADLKVVAYELLYRSDDQLELSNVLNGDQATSNVLINAYTSIFDNHESRQLPAFLNMTRELVENDALPSMSQKHVVVEVLEDIKVDQQLIDALRRFREAGYRIALDDFVYAPEFDPLLEMAQIVKLDVLALGLEGTRQQVDLIRRFKVTLLAEKIETYEELRACIDMGFKLFQGYFLSRPQIVEGRRLGSNELVLLQLMTALDDPEIDLQEIESLINHDPALTYRLLKIVNSASFGLPRKVSNISQALIIIGLQEIKKWVTLISLSGQKNKPTELTRQILIFAQMCEQLTKRSPEFRACGNAGFLTGLLCHMDAILDIDRHTLLKQISVSDEISAAVLGGEGVLGSLVSRVTHYTNGEWDQLESIDAALYNQCYVDCLSWCRETMELIDD